MNSGHISKRSHALFGVLVLFLALAGCAVGHLSDRIVIDRMTRVTDVNGQPVPVGDPGDFLHTNDIAKKGIALGPGDVLRYTRWSPGNADSDLVASNGQTHEPTSDSYGIALRSVGADGYLHPDEERFLSSILTTQRLSWAFENYGAQDKLAQEVFLGEVQAALQRMQVPLWNSLVKNIQIRRFQQSSSAPFLAAMLDMKAVCNSMKKDVAPKDLGLFEQAYIHPNTKSCDSVALSPAELMANPWRLESPFYAAVNIGEPIAQQTDINNPNNRIIRYFLLESGTYTQFNFVEAEINGVRVDDRSSPAANWTLREWEQSEVCRFQEDRNEFPVIRRIRLLDGRRKLWISRTNLDPPPTYQIITHFTSTDHRRRVERISLKFAYEDHAVLADSALDELRMADIDFIEWAYPNIKIDQPKAKAHVAPSGCTFPGTL
jgi:hypothetical protein